MACSFLFLGLLLLPQQPCVIATTSIHPIPSSSSSSSSSSATSDTTSSLPPTQIPPSLQNTMPSNDGDVASSAVDPVPWWTGVPTKLIRKVTLVDADPTIGRLPVYTLTFAIPDDPDGIMVGQAKSHKDVAIDLGDVVKMVIPNYKPKSYSISALRPEVGEFDVTLKVYPNGRASGVLDRLELGDHIYSFGKSANRTRNPGSFVGIVVFGVGITEGLPVARAECEKLTAAIPTAPSSSTATPKVKLLWASRTMEDTFWHDDIKSLQEQYPTIFEIVYLLSRQEREGCLHGHVTPQLLRDVFQPPIQEEARFLSVGTKEMMRMTDAMFTEIGYPMPQHHLLPKGGDGGGSKKEKHNKHKTHDKKKEKHHDPWQQEQQQQQQHSEREEL